MTHQSKKYLNSVIEEVDNLACSHPASVNLEVANTYYSLTKMVRPKLVVEIGCFIGFSSLHFAQALYEQGFGELISIDPFDWDVDAGQGIESREQVAKRYLKKSGLENIVTYVKGYSNEVHPLIEKQIRNKIDLLYIDGDHSIHGVFADFNNYYNDVRVGGLIILHDIYPSMSGVHGPRALLDQLKLARMVPGKLDVLELPTSDGFGISVLRKNCSKSLKLRSATFRRALVYLKRKTTFLKKKSGSDKLAAGLYIEVLDSKNRKPVAGARIACPQRGNEHRFTNQDGIFLWHHYLPNRYEFYISANGYTTVEKFFVDFSTSSIPQKFTVLLEPITQAPE